MALLVGGQVEAAERAYAWCLATQRADGSWPMKIVAGVVEDASGETNMSAYVAVGVWHHWLVRRDLGVRAPALAGRAPRPRLGRLACSCRSAGSPGRRSGPTAGPARVNEEALLAGSSSIHHALRAGCRPRRAARRPAAGVGAGRRPARATRCASTATCSWTSRRSRWTGTTRCSAAPSAARPAHGLLRARWDDFVVPGLGIRCVDTNPWVTGAETCELVLALDALGDRDARRCGCSPTCSTCAHDDGGYWTGYVYPDEVTGRPSTRRTPPRR